MSSRKRKSSLKLSSLLPAKKFMERPSGLIPYVKVPKSKLEKLKSDKSKIFQCIPELRSTNSSLLQMIYLAFSEQKILKNENIDGFNLLQYFYDRAELYSTIFIKKVNDTMKLALEDGSLILTGGYLFLPKALQCDPYCFECQNSSLDFDKNAYNCKTCNRTFCKTCMFEQYLDLIIDAVKYAEGRFELMSSLPMCPYCVFSQKQVNFLIRGRHPVSDNFTKRTNEALLLLLETIFHTYEEFFNQLTTQINLNSPFRELFIINPYSLSDLRNDLLTNNIHHTGDFLFKFKQILHNYRILNILEAKFQEKTVELILDSFCIMLEQVTICPECFIRGVTRNSIDTEIEDCEALHCFALIRDEFYDYWPAKITRFLNNRFVEFYFIDQPFINHVEILENCEVLSMSHDVSCQKGTAHLAKAIGKCKKFLKIRQLDNSFNFETMQKSPVLTFNAQRLFKQIINAEEVRCADDSISLYSLMKLYQSEWSVLKERVEDISTHISLSTKEIEHLLAKQTAKISLSKPTRCHECKKNLKRLFACGNCFLKIYCSEICQAKDWRKIHSKVCGNNN